ncbi:hypothetical protein ACN38_g2836 [Penicillium nordicum]|uniref:Uncharacterized protein n=1 Tax=Penicillium nordicum TaxID=229535 RepID=A0A0M8PE16_9EURO|nr:hypothetical protein ACN38_g2836 [Penicillium nordicum]
MSTLTPHHVGFTTLTFHLASLLYTIERKTTPCLTQPLYLNGISFACCCFHPPQHNEQQPGLQSAVTQPLYINGISFACCCFHPSTRIAVCSYPGISSLIVCDLPALHPLACVCLHLDLLGITDTFYIQYTPPPRL